MQAATPTAVDVSVLVPVLNEGPTIREVVDAMISQRLDGTVEFLFADGRSTDDTKSQLQELARADPRIRVLDNPRRGVASGLNVCLRAARGRYVARMDGHALYPPTYLREGVKRLEESDARLEAGSNARVEAGIDPGAYGGAVAWVAGPQIPIPRGRVAAAFAAALGTWFGRGGSRRWAAAKGDVGEYELDTGVFCGVWRREDVLLRGGWDEGWLCNEDSELAARFSDAGQRIVCLPVMAAGYFPRTSLPALWRQYRDYGMYRAKTARRHPASLRRSAVLPPLLVFDALASVIARGRLRRMARIGIRAYVLALLAASVQAAFSGRGSPLGSFEAAVKGHTLLGSSGAVPSRHQSALGSFGIAVGESGSEVDGGKRTLTTDFVLIPGVMATMHAAHGVGFLVGCVRWGVPWRGLWKMAGGAERLRPYSGPIEAPSLLGEQGRSGPSYAAGIRVEDAQG